MKKTHSLISAFMSVALAFAVAGCQIDSDRHEHSFSKDWTSDATDHWHAATCEHTKEVSDKAAHTFGEWKTTVEATEETEGKEERSCSVCSYKEEQSLAKLDHTHKFSSDWTNDATDHWHAATCGHAEEVSAKTAHTFGEWKTTVEATEETEGKKERSCSVCLYKEEQSLAKLDHTHKFSSDWTSNATDHWHAATCEHAKEVSDKTAHTFGEWKTTVEATEETEGKKERSCSVCLYKEEQSLAKLDHTHKFLSDWTSNATDHWHAATCEHAKEVSGKTAHTFGEWKTTVEATEETEGKKERICSVCSYKDEQSLAKLDHTHKFSSDWTSDATDHWHAATCGHAEEVSGKAKHTFGDWTVIKAATEEAEGSKERSCSVCGYTATEAIEKLAHTHKFATDWTKDETNHWHAATCEHTSEVSGKAEHTFGNWTTTKAATEEAEGTKERTCTVCGYTATEAIEKLAHTHKFATDWTKDETNHWYAATCGHDVTDSKAEHSFGDWTVTKEATCTENGERKTTCTVCGYEKTEVTDKAEHTFGEYVSNNDATTEADGTKTRECSVCGYKDTVTDEGSKIIVPEGFVFVKGGTVTGAAYTNNYEGVFIKGRTVTLSDFYMGKYEVTHEEYASVMEGQKVTVNGTEYALESNPSYCTEDSTDYTLFNGDVQEKRPVEGVTWYDAVWYCNALSEKEGLTKAYNIEGTKVVQTKTGYCISSANVTLNKNAKGYRLPTEAEWEFAARGGDPTKDDWNYVFSGANTAEGVSYNSSKNVGLDSVGWYGYNSINGTTGDTWPSAGEQGYGTHQVGKKAPNRLGLYDMSGNVWEWCYDWMGTITITTPADGATSGSRRVFRGGSWGDNARGSSVSNHFNYAGPDVRYYSIGFRVVRSSSN